MPPVLLVGGAVVDRKYRLAGPPVPGSSNPGAGATSHGGVARNITESLARLGVPAAFFSAVGADEAGRALLDRLDALGVDVSGTLVVEGARTAEYVAVLAPEGDLVVGVADMAVLEAHLDAVVARALARLEPGGWLFADCNLPSDALSRLVAAARGRGTELVLDAVSVPKAKRLPGDLSGVGLLVLNRDEARAATGLDAEPGPLATALAGRGARRVVVTAGARGVHAVEGGGTPVFLPAIPAKVVDVTGAGDGFVAATLAGLARGLAFGDALRDGLLAATLTIETEASARADLAERLAERRGAP
jgi:pseudouridine kinase